ncbi:S9 family peptidase [Nesterenkonia halobia]|uniref:S9 family peptidase n=1 Tax=Nesterenkonia halobia TaxID=37922 RepID=A0ABP6RAI6_9MICC
MTDTTSTSPAAASPSGARKFHDLDHFVAFPRLAGLAMSPDGERLVTTVSTLDAQGTGYTTALWEVDPRGGHTARRLTRGSAAESGPTFSAAGDLWFTSARPDESGSAEDAKTAALWRLPADGGEAEVVTRRPGGVSSVLCAADADVVLAAAPLLPGAADEDQHAALQTARTEGEVQAILHTGYPVRHWDHDLGPARPHLFAVDGEEAPDDAAVPATVEPPRRRLRALTADLGTHYGDEAFLSPDGTRALIAVTLPEPAADQRTGLAVVDVAAGERRMLADDPASTYSPGPISPDGRTAVVTVTRRPVPERALRPMLHILDLETGALTPLIDESSAEAELWFTPADWLPDGSAVIALADRDGRGPVFRLDVADGTVTVLTDDEATWSEAIVSPDGAHVYGVRASYAFPNEIARLDLADGTVTRLENPVRRPELPGRLTEIETVAEDGARVRAWLALPGTEGEGAPDAPDAPSSSPAPLLLWIHGGPLNSWNAWSWRWNPWLLVARGYAVLLPDPALSTGYGQEFIQRGWNAWGEKPYTDLLAITDAAETRDDVDATRTAAMGGSFGGYMANWVAGHTDRFDAIVTHASLWALDQFGPTTDMSPFWRRQIDPTMEAEHSPHRFVSEIRTPMLVIHGDKDYRVPIGEGLRLWYELLEQSGLPADADGNTVHRFLYFPQENHWVLTPHHAKLWYQVVIAFLAEHVRGEAPELPTTLGLTPPASE